MNAADDEQQNRGDAEADHGRHAHPGREDGYEEEQLGGRDQHTHDGNAPPLVAGQRPGRAEPARHKRKDEKHCDSGDRTVSADRQR